MCANSSKLIHYRTHGVSDDLLNGSFSVSHIILLTCNERRRTTRVKVQFLPAFTLALRPSSQPSQVLAPLGTVDRVAYGRGYFPVNRTDRQPSIYNEKMTDPKLSASSLRPSAYHIEIPCQIMLFRKFLLFHRLVVLLESLQLSISSIPSTGRRLVQPPTKPANCLCPVTRLPPLFFRLPPSL